MEAELIEKYETLGNLKPGDVAVSKDRTKIYICGIWTPDSNKDDNIVVFNLNDLKDSYSYGRDLNEPVRILRRGDTFTITV